MTKRRYRRFHGNSPMKQTNKEKTPWLENLIHPIKQFFLHPADEELKDVEPGRSYMTGTGDGKCKKMRCKRRSRNRR